MRMSAALARRSAPGLGPGCSELPAGRPPPSAPPAGLTVCPTPLLAARVGDARTGIPPAAVSSDLCVVLASVCTFGLGKHLLGTHWVPAGAGAASAGRSQPQGAGGGAPVPRALKTRARPFGPAAGPPPARPRPLPAPQARPLFLQRPQPGSDPEPGLGTWEAPPVPAGPLPGLQPSAQLLQTVTVREAGVTLTDGRRGGGGGP